MPAKKLRQPKQVREKLPGAAVSKLRKTQSEPTSTVDGKRLASLIPVVRKRGRPSLASKFDPTVDINDALKRLGKGFFTGEEKDLFKTPLKVGPAESQKQRRSAAGLSSSPSRSNKRGAGRSRSSSVGSPGSKASSSDSPYFLRSKGAADDVVDDSLLQPKRRQKSAGLDSAEKKSPARKPKSTGLDSAEKGTPARKTKSGGLDSAEKGTPARKTKSGGLDSAEKKTPAKRGRKSFQSPPHKKAEAEKPVSLVKASRASLSGRKDNNLEKSVLDKERLKSVKKDAAETTAIVRTPAKSRRQTKTSQDLASENEAEETVRLETGKKRKREEDDTDDPKTKRAKVMIVDSEKIREMAQEANQRTTLKLMVHRANIEDLGDKVVLNSGGDQASYRRLVPYEEKRKTPASTLNEVSQTRRGQSRTTEVTVVTSSHSMSSRNRSSIFEPSDNTALDGSFQRLNEASRDLDETARRQLHDLTANISVRDSWSAHLYDKGSRSASKLPRASAAGNSQRMSMDALRPLSAVTPSVDFQVKWDTSAVKEQLLSSVRPQKVWADELATGPKIVTATEGNSQPSGKGLLEKPRADTVLLDTVPMLVTAREAHTRPSSKGLLERPRAEESATVPMLVMATEANSQAKTKGLLEESAVIFTSSVATPLRRPDIDKSVFERDGVEFGENMRLRSSRKTVVTEEKTEIRRRPSGNYSAVPFNTPVQQLRGNGASVRHSVDRMLSPAVDRVNVIRGRSVEPGMIRSESIHMRPKFNGQMAMKELNPVVEMRGGRCGRVCRRSLCLVGTSVLAIGTVWLVHLALAAGYLGELF